VTVQHLSDIIETKRFICAKSMSIIQIAHDECLNGHLVVTTTVVLGMGVCDTANKAPPTNCSVDHCDLPFVKRRQ